MLGWLVVAAAAGFAVLPWVLILRSPRGDEGTLDEWARTRR